MSRTSVQFRPGRRPAQPARPHLKLGPSLDHAKLGAPPASVDWLSPVPADAWGVLGNDQVGDCTCAGVAHKRIGDVYVNQGQVLPVTTDETLTLYSAVTGFNPNAGPPGANPTDCGAVCQDVLDYWHKHGFLGEKIVAYAKVELSNEAEVKQAVAIFGQLYCGFHVPASAEDQFNAGEPWDVEPGAPILGGHCVTVGAYDANGPSCVTWGQVQSMSWQFWRTYFDEAWIVIGPDFVSKASGQDIQGLSLHQLGADFAALTGRPNPIPAPVVPRHHIRLADELRHWLQEMGL